VLAPQDFVTPLVLGAPAPSEPERQRRILRASPIATGPPRAYSNSLSLPEESITPGSGEIPMRSTLKTRLGLLLSCLLLAGCSGSNKNVTSEEVEAVKNGLTAGQLLPGQKPPKWKSFEGFEDPDNKKIKYVRVLYTVEGDSTTHDMLVKLEDGKSTGQWPNGAGENWKKDIQKVPFPAKHVEAELKNVGSEEPRDIKAFLTSGQPGTEVEKIVWKSFEGMDDPDNKKVRYVRVVYIDPEKKTKEALVKLEEGKPVAQAPNAAGDDWQKDIKKVKWPGK
jgi:hypothetical protein